MSPPSTFIFSVLFILLGSGPGVMASSGTNLCAGAYVTASATSTGLSYASDGLLVDQHACTAALCAEIKATDNDFWITLDLGEVKTLRTIIFLTGDAQNSLDWATMTRTVGTNSDYTDTSTNTVLA